MSMLVVVGVVTVSDPPSMCEIRAMVVVLDLVSQDDLEVVVPDLGDVVAADELDVRARAIGPAPVGIDVERAARRVGGGEVQPVEPHRRVRDLVGVRRRPDGREVRRNGHDRPRLGRERRRHGRHPGRGRGEDAGRRVDRAGDRRRHGRDDAVGWGVRGVGRGRGLREGVRALGVHHAPRLTRDGQRLVVEDRVHELRGLLRLGGVGRVDGVADDGEAGPCYAGLRVLPDHVEPVSVGVDDGVVAAVGGAEVEEGVEVRRPEADVLLALQVFDLKAVAPTRLEDVPRVVGRGDLRRLERVRHHARDERPVGIAPVEREEDLGALPEREVERLGVAGVRLHHPDARRGLAVLEGALVEEDLDEVAAVLVELGVVVVELPVDHGLLEAVEARHGRPPLRPPLHVRGGGDDVEVVGHVIGGPVRGKPHHLPGRRGEPGPLAAVLDLRREVRPVEARVIDHREGVAGPEDHGAAPDALEDDPAREQLLGAEARQAPAVLRRHGVLRVEGDLSCQPDACASPETSSAGLR